jgi:hypothetical protein
LARAQAASSRSTLPRPQKAVFFSSFQFFQKESAALVKCWKWFQVTSVVYTITRHWQVARCESESDSRPRPCASVSSGVTQAGPGGTGTSGLDSALLKAPGEATPVPGGAAHLVHWRWHLAFKFRPKVPPGGPGAPARDLRLGTGTPSWPLAVAGRAVWPRSSQGAAHARAAPSPLPSQRPVAASSFSSLPASASDIYHDTAAIQDACMRRPQSHGDQDGEGEPHPPSSGGC